MRIAYVINSVEGGGAALPVPAVAGLLRDHGAAVRIFALTRRDGRALAAIARAGFEAEVRSGGKTDHFAALRWLDERVTSWRASLIWTSLTRATLLGQLVGAHRHLPVVSWQHNAGLKRANLLLLRAMQQRSALWIGDSASVTALTATRLGIPPERLATWPLFAADPDAPQAAPWQPGETLRLGMLGRLHPAKGHDILIAALAHLKATGFTPPVPFTIDCAGDGGERDRIVALLAEHAITNVRLSGFCAEPGAFLAGLHLFLQPSRQEGLCIAAHEAMQAALPVIASAVGEMPYSVVEGETGLVVPPADPRALAAALRGLLSAPEQLAAMGAAGRARVLDRFGPEKFAAAGAAIYARLPTG